MLKPLDASIAPPLYTWIHMHEGLLGITVIQGRHECPYPLVLTEPGHEFLTKPDMINALAILAIERDTTMRLIKYLPVEVVQELEP